MSLTELDRAAERVIGFIHSCSGDCGRHKLPTLNHKLFNSLALDLFALQYQLIGPYRRFCTSRGASPQTVHSWEQIPAMPTTGFKELDLSALPPDSRTRVFLSSGTTEHRPSRHFHNAKSLAVYENSLWPWFAVHLIPELRVESSAGAARACPTFPQSLIALTPSPDEAPQSSLVHMFDVVAQKLSVEEVTWLGKANEGSGWSVASERACHLLQGLVEKGQPTLVLGTAFSFVHLLDHLLERGATFQLPPGSRAMETGGYKGRSRTLSKSELHSLIEERLGISQTHIVCEYGMSELSSQAYDVVCGESGPGSVSRQLRFPPWARLQVVSAETGREVGEGETGLLRIFDLANVYSVMPIQTEDLAIRRGDAFELRGRSERAEPRGCSLMAR